MGSTITTSTTNTSSTSSKKEKYHTCERSENSYDRFDFCKSCQVLMSKKTGQEMCSKFFIRTEKFCKPDIFGVNPNHTFEKLIERQGENRFYNISFKDFEARQNCLNNIRTCCRELKLSEACFHNSVGVFDAVLSVLQIQKDQLKLLSYLAIYISAKYVDNEVKIPKMDYFVNFLEGKFSRQDFVQYELSIIENFKWQLSLRTPYIFLNFFFSLGVVSASELPNDMSQETCLKFVEELQNRAIELAEASLNGYVFYKFTSVGIATSALALARGMFGLSPLNEDLESMTYVRWEAIQECVVGLNSEWELVKQRKMRISELEMQKKQTQKSTCQTYLREEVERAQTYSRRGLLQIYSTDDKKSEKSKKGDLKKTRKTKKQSIETNSEKGKTRKKSTTFPFGIGEFTVDQKNAGLGFLEESAEEMSVGGSLKLKKTSDEKRSF